MITKPLTWVFHLDKENTVPIFSIDVSSRGDCFATGGEDGIVNVWSFAKALDLDVSETFLLAKIKVHEQPVNSVRFNSTGKFLATGGSDGVVSVSVMVRKTEWTPFRKWNQHKLDVSEVAWGTGEKRKLLASSSFDGTIAIWDVERGHAFHIISDHHSIIKGIAWDPLGQYLASQADTEGIFIWRTSDWKCVKQISEPFKETADASDHLRLSWSPDGMFLTGVQAYTLPQPYAAVLSRDRWKLEFCIVGHRSGVSISKWNPKFFLAPGPSSSTEANRLTMCLCLGSVDRSFSLWRQTDQHPMLHMDGYFDDRISDIAWSADGYTCLVSSRDGSVALCNFTEEELGVVAEHRVSPQDVLPLASRMPVTEDPQIWLNEKESLDKRERVETQMPVLDNRPKRQKKFGAEEGLSSRMALDASRSKKKTSELMEISPRRAPATDRIQLPPLRDVTERRTSLRCSCGRRRDSNGEWTTVQISVENVLRDGICVVKCSEGDVELWRDEMKGNATHITGTMRYSAVATDNGRLHVYDEVGMRRIPSMQLPSPVSWLISNTEWLLLAVTYCGELCLWDLQERRLLCRTSVCPLCKQTRLSTIKISPNSLPIVTITDGTSFLFNPSLEVWTLFSNASKRASEARLGSSQDMDVDISIDSLAKHTRSTDSKHELEQGIMNAIDLQSPSDYRDWLLAYVRFLVTRMDRNESSRNEEKLKLRKICSDLLHGTSTEFVGLSTIEFLTSKILPEMMKVRELHRLGQEIRTWIDSL